jgi:hypothetical protein
VFVCLFVVFPVCLFIRIYLPAVLVMF